MPEWLASAWAWLAPLVAAPFVVPPALRGIHKFWIRPIIQVSLDDKPDCHAPTPLVSKQDGKTVARVMYLRLRVRNRGSTTINDCFGNLVRIVVVDDQENVFDFASEVSPLGWAHYPASKQRNIPRGETYYLDIATLLLSEDRRHNSLYLAVDPMPTSLIDFLQSVPQGRAIYSFEVRVGADNARPRSIPVLFAFDPARSNLSFIPFDTRYPGWRWRWWSRSLERRHAFALAFMALLIIVALIAWLAWAVAEPLR